MPLMWWAQPGWSPAVLTAWMIAAGLLLFTATTIFIVPYESFMLELTPDYQERTNVASIKMLVSALSGPLIGWAWYFTQLPVFQNTLEGARALTLGVAVVMLAAGVAPALLARERYYAGAKHQTRVSLAANMMAALRNRAFRNLACICICAVTASAISASLSFYTVLYFVCRGDQKLAATMAGVHSMLFLGVSVLAVLVLQRVATRLGKTRTLAVALAFSLAAMLCRWWTLRPDLPWLSLASAPLLAIGITGMWQIMPAMTADIADDEELASGARREGAIASMFSWCVRLSFAVGYGVPGLIVAASDFVVEKGGQQGEGVLTTLRLWEIGLPATLTVAAMALLLPYRLSPQRMGAIRLALEARRGKL